MLGNLFGREERAISTAPWGNWTGDATPSWSGKKVDASSALQLVTVYGCVRLICDSISTLPLNVHRDSGNGAETLPLPVWLEEPVVGLHRVSWLTQVLSSLLLDGNAYLIVTRDSAGRILELIPVPCSQVYVTREGGKRVYYVNGVVSAHEILHIPGLMLAGADAGYSPIEAARQSIGLGLAAQEFGARFFGQGANMSGVIQVPGDLPPDKATEMARMMARKHSGLDKAHIPAVLGNGAEWKPTGVTNEQAQFLETRGYTAAEIAGQMFMVDPSEFGLQAGSGGSITYANLEQRNARKVQVTLLPWIVRLEMALSGLLAKPRYVKFNVNGLLRGDTLARYQAYQIGIQSKFLVPNEPRGWEDLSPLDGGDEVVSSPAPVPPQTPSPSAASAAPPGDTNA